MKVLLSAFDCNPLFGSDPYVGWSWVINMAKKNEVYALIRTDHKPYIEQFCSENTVEHIENIHFIYIDSSKFWGTVVYKFNNYMAVVGAYCMWQKKAYRVAKKLHKKENFDICHVVSIADFRFPGYLWKIPVPFIFGPVGGGQETPCCLSKYLIGHEKNEKFRTLMNKLFTMLPNYKKALNHSAVIYCSNDETQAIISKKIYPDRSKRIKHLTELGINDLYIKEREKLVKGDNDKVHILLSGRLMYRKGIQLLIDAVRYLETSIPYVIDIYGDGEQKKELLDIVKKYGLSEKVIFHGKVSFIEMQEKYKKADIYCLPSLRETTGTAVFEAMANKLPVIALRQNGVKYIVEEDAGILVDIIDEQQVVKDFSSALKILIENHNKRISMGYRAFQKIKQQYTWNVRIENMNHIYECLNREV